MKAGRGPVPQLLSFTDELQCEVEALRAQLLAAAQEQLACNLAMQELVADVVPLVLAHLRGDVAAVGAGLAEFAARRCKVCVAPPGVLQ